MTSDPAPVPDENPPPQRPDADPEQRAIDASEMDLWDLDDTAGSKSYAASASKKAPPEPAEREDPGADAPPPQAIPMAPRTTRRESFPIKDGPMGKSIAGRKTVGKARLSSEQPPAIEPEPAIPEPVRQPVKAPVKPARYEARPVELAFSDLENEAETPAVSRQIPEDRATEASPEVPVEPVPEATDVATVDFSQELASSKKPVDLPPPKTRPGFSNLERIALISFVLLMVGAGVFLGYSLRQLPEKKESLTAKDFPIQGERLQALKAESYWRAPVATGANIDTFRRGTSLLPVLELKVAGGPAAVRILFRDSEGQTVGDGVTRPVNGPATLKIPATAGFEDIGMHAAYRTGDTKPWVVKVSEGPSANSPGKEFKTLFEIPISPDRR